MGNFCANPPENKKEYIVELGKVLVENYGKKKYYTPEEVKNAHKKSNRAEGNDFACFGMSIFSSHNDFDKYHEETGEVCDYVAMKSEMLSGISESSITHLTESGDVDLDASWLEFGDVFGGILEGIGSFISSIFEG